MKKILMIVTAANHITLKEGLYFAGGVYASEFAEPYKRFREAGFEIDIATPGGNVPPIDPISLTPMVSGNKIEKIIEYFTMIQKSKEFNNPKDVNQLSPDQLSAYSAIYIPGGYGPMEDLSGLSSLGELLNKALEKGIIISTTCHGTAALLTARKENGEWTFKGYKITGFSKAEEMIVGLKDRLPFLIEDKVKEMGGDYSSAVIPFTSHVVEDRNLITGQNHISSPEVADKVLEKMKVAHPA